MCLSTLGRIGTSRLLSSQTKSISWSTIRTLSNEGSTSRHRTAVYYSTSVIFIIGGLSYAAVPLYRIFCQVRVIHRLVSFVQSVNAKSLKTVMTLKSQKFQSSGNAIRFRAECFPFQSTGSGGQAAFFRPAAEDIGDKVERMEAVKHRFITVNFQADVASGMR